MIDKQTGSEFTLRVPAGSVDECRDRLFGLGFVVGDIAQAKPFARDDDYREAVVEHERKMKMMADLGHEPFGDETPDGKVRDCGGSEQLDEILPVLRFECHPLDLHYALMHATKIAYTVGNPGAKNQIKAQSRTPPEEAWPLVEQLGWQWIAYAEVFRPLLWQRIGDRHQYLQVTVFGHLARYLTKEGFPERAEEVRRLERTTFGD